MKVSASFIVCKNALTFQRLTCWKRCLSWTQTSGSLRSRQNPHQFHQTSLISTLTMLRSQVEKVNEQALAHPYLAQYADPTDEPASLPYDQVRIITTIVVVTAIGQTLKSLFLTFLFSSDFWGPWPQRAGVERWQSTLITLISVSENDSQNWLPFQQTKNVFIFTILENLWHEMTNFQPPAPTVQ